MSKVLNLGRLMAWFRSSIAIVLAALYLSPDPALADGNFVEGVVIGKNDHGAPLDGVSVESESTVGGRPCLLQRARTGRKGSFRLRLDPGCPFLTLRFSKAGYLDATVDVNNSGAGNDVGAVELQPSFPIHGSGPVVAARTRFAIIVIVAVAVVTTAATIAVVKH
jgi:hypothetical protein